MKNLHAFESLITVAAIKGRTASLDTPTTLRDQCGLDEGMKGEAYLMTPADAAQVVA